MREVLSVNDVSIKVKLNSAVTRTQKNHTRIQFYKTKKHLIQCENSIHRLEYIEMGVKYHIELSILWPWICWGKSMTFLQVIDKLCHKSFIKYIYSVVYTVLKMKIRIYWSESNSWIYYIQCTQKKCIYIYIYLNKNWKMYWSKQSCTGLGL
jgi:hypothetical protein